MRVCIHMSICHTTAGMHARDANGAFTKKILNLSIESKARYTSKVTSAGFNIDPYCIDQWTETPEDAPDVQCTQ